MNNAYWYAAPLCGAALSLALLSVPVFAESQPRAESTPIACVGDCGGDGSVTVDELLTMVNIALGTAMESACPAGDADNSGDISVDEIVAAVNNALNSCEPTGLTPTPEPTLPLTPTASPTVTPEPAISKFKGTLAATSGRFNYNLTLGLPGSDAACNTMFPGSHTCTYAELQTADAANELLGVPDKSFWAIDSAQPFNRQCNTSIPWDYQTAHTGRFGDVVPLTGGHLGSLVPSSICANSHAVGCCQ